MSKNRYHKYGDGENDEEPILKADASLADRLDWGEYHKDHPVFQIQLAWNFDDMDLVEEILAGYVNTNDPFVLGLCAEAAGHLARLGGFDAVELREHVLENAQRKFPKSEIVANSIRYMDDLREYYLPMWKRIKAEEEEDISGSSEASQSVEDDE